MLCRVDAKELVGEIKGANLRMLWWRAGQYLVSLFLLEVKEV